MRVTLLSRCCAAHAGLSESVRAPWVSCDELVGSYDAKHGTDVIIHGRNFGDDATLHGVVTLNGTECSSTAPVACL